MVASYEKVERDGLVTSCDNSPHEVGQDIPVLVLATAVITVQVDLLLIVLKVVVEIGYDGIGTLAELRRLRTYVQTHSLRPGIVCGCQTWCN